MRSDMEEWKAIRQDVLVNGLSQRSACAKNRLGWHTLKKILAHVEPPGYRQSQMSVAANLGPGVADRAEAAFIRERMTLHPPVHQ